ncbi:MAG: electron transfer flavoprotein subunit beta [Planctomycetes bacterium]|nr:electron transfer flavoprotein subunit beta [Planctomycetota bacterium]
MSHYIVLVKQVPDVSQIGDDAFDPKTGNLIRTRLPSVINELDAQALAFAHQMRQLAGDEGAKLVVLTMGPPMAAEVLRYSLSRYADMAVLLTDRALGGADTWATANPLACAIRKIVREILDNSSDYYIVAGMQSVDGDTAQVPAQIAEELKIPCIPYATKAEYVKDHFVFTRIISGGNQVLRTRSKPCIITVAKNEYPLFASFAASRKAGRTKLIQWDAAAVGAAVLGVAGSKTRVIRVFPPGKTSRKCRQVNTAAEMAAILKENFSRTARQNETSADKTRKYVLPTKRNDPYDRSYEATDKESEDFIALAKRFNALAMDEHLQISEATKDKILDSPDIPFHKKALEDMLESYKHIQPVYTGDVWVMAQIEQGQIHPSTLELLGKARSLADSLDVRCGVILAGDQVRLLAKELIAAGADDVYVIEHPLLAAFDPACFCKVAADVIAKYRPQIVLYGATPDGRVLAPMVSYRLGCGLTADCTGLDIRDSSRKGQIAILLQTRPALGGNVMATICTKDSFCQMATARPGVMRRLTADSNRVGSIIEHSVELTEADLSLGIIRTEHAQGKVNFDSDVIVSGGKGMQNRDDYNRLLGDLCDTIHKRFHIAVEKGASRSAVEQGFAQRIHQVGQTGTAVGPKVYIAVGISGAIQHMIGVANTETIFAINTDPHAPIFHQCDYYIIGNAEQVIPQLAEALKG